MCCNWIIARCVATGLLQGVTTPSKRRGSPTRVNLPRRKRGSISPSTDSCRDEVAIRKLISLYYVYVLGAPPAEEWDGLDGTISIISKDLSIPAGSRNLVLRVLTRTNEAIDSGESYDGDRRKGC